MLHSFTNVFILKWKNNEQTYVISAAMYNVEQQRAV